MKKLKNLKSLENDIEFQEEYQAISVEESFNNIPFEELDNETMITILLKMLIFVRKNHKKFFSNFSFLEKIRI